MKVAFVTLGCRVNQYETEAMVEKFIRDGYETVKFEEFADVYVINSCTVTNMGDKKSRQMIGRARRLNSEAIIAVVGCYSQVSPKEVAAIEGVDIVLGSRNKSNIVYWVNRVRDERNILTDNINPIIDVNDVIRNNKFDELAIETYQDRTRAFLKIQDGCNRFCSYCLIPYARGGVCSKEPKKVISEVKELALNGFKEVILSGIHTASYGMDLDENISLTDILEQIENIDGIERIRIGSIDPTFFTGDVMKRLSSLKKLCPHFHLSLQSGCDSTLKRMNRRYTTKQYKETVEALRQCMKGVSITTDIIVGFPGETEEEFNETYEYLKEISLSKIHIFKYSPRKGTAAAKMKDDVSAALKEERSKKLSVLNEENEKSFIEKFVGQEMEVLYEQKSTFGENLYEGYTNNYIKVITPMDNEAYVGKIIKTKLVNYNKGFAYGILEEV